MAPADVAKEKLQVEQMTTGPQTKKLHKEHAENAIAVFHPNTQDLTDAEITPNSALEPENDADSQDAEMTPNSALEPENDADSHHTEKTFTSPRLGRCPRCHRRTDVSNLTESRNRFTCQHKKCKKPTAVKKWLCVNCSRTKGTDIQFDRCLCYARSLRRGAVPF